MALLVQLLIEAMRSEFDGTKVFLLKGDIVNLRLCFSICVPYLFNNCKLCVPVEIMLVSMEVFACRDGIIILLYWMVCIGPVII